MPTPQQAAAMADKVAKEPLIDWDPTPGFLLCKALKREELNALYNRSGAGALSLPDRVGKVSDSVGAGQVIKLGPPELRIIDGTNKSKAEIDAELQRTTLGLEPGDYVAWMPFTDLIIEIDGAKYSLIGYDKIRAVRKGTGK